MSKFAISLICGFLVWFQLSGAQPQKPINHGGKIETRYDGFNHQTVLRLRKMKVTCDGFKG